MKPTDPDSKVRCSFCGKEARDVKKLIAGPKVHICDECVSLCREIIVEDQESEEAEGEKGLEEMRPKEIKAFLDEYVIGQEPAKRTISVAVYNHYKRIKAAELTEDLDVEFDEEEKEVELNKGNILMLGPTGSGKTLMAQSLARKLDVPFTIADATSLTEAGYVGEDVENVIKNLWLAADRDAERASRGIICIDEIDKATGGQGGSPSSTRDVGGEGVQQALLQMVESNEVMITPEGSRNRPQQEFIQIDTSNILFICCGSFDGLNDVIAKRMGESRMGFGADIETQDEEEDNLLQHARPEDLIEYGLIPEFVGRFPVIVSFDQLTEDELVEILWRPKNSLVKQYKKLFELENVQLRFEEEAMRSIVRKAIERKTGARGLRSILEEIMLDIMYELPSLKNARECVITPEVVEEGEEPMITYEKKSA
jgi:ATP-dependent Clp protease ATP-binding subunit ClpX